MLKHLQTIPVDRDLEKKIKKKRKKLSKQTVNVFRTTQRNNIELTAIADNKASVLLSLNAVMVTFLTPIVIAYSEMVVERYLYIPLGILCLTCLTTIYIAAQVLKPSNFDKVEKMSGGEKPSPFFFGNFYKMEAKEFLDFAKHSLGESDLLKLHLAQDLFFVGQRLGKKMFMIRRAFNLFIAGVFLTILSTIVVLLFL